MGRIIVTPAAVINANTPTNFPTGSPLIRSFFAVARNRLTEGTPNVFAKTTLTVVTTTPSGGEVRLVGDNQFEFGDATADTDQFEFDVEESGELIRSV